MQTLNEIIFVGGFILGILLFILAANNTFNEILPLKTQHENEIIALLDTYPIIANQTSLTIDERLDLLRAHHLLTADQEAQIVLMQKEHSIEESAANYGWISFLGIVVILVSAIVTVIREDS